MLNTLPTVVFTDKILQFFNLTEVSELRAIDKKIKQLITTHRHHICTKICFHILPHGEFTLRNKDGTIARTTTFKEGIKHGEEKDFDEGILIHSLQFSEGQKHGEEIYFHHGGMQMTPYKKGKKHGLEKYFRQVEDIIATRVLVQASPYKEGQLHGEEKHWNLEGVLTKITKFEEGQKHGDVKCFYPLTGLMITTPYKKGLKHGVEKYFRQVEDGGFHGEGLLVQTTRVLVQASPFKEGKLHGEEKHWNIEGVLTKITKFEDGQKITSSCEGITSDLHDKNIVQLKKRKSYS
jgi:antitoxin component YwqK of YwqJK toxin-antitoxin module